MRAVLLAVALMAGVSPACAESRFDGRAGLDKDEAPVPRVYASQGSHRLWVIPDTTEGATGAEYRLLDGRREVWRSTLWFVADGALVFETGEVWVYAVVRPARPEDGEVENSGDQVQGADAYLERLLADLRRVEREADFAAAARLDESFELVVLEPDGRIRMQEKNTRDAFAGIVRENEDLAPLGVFAHIPTDRVIVRFRGTTDHLPEYWRIYSSSRADLLDTIEFNIHEASRWPSAPQHLLEVDSIAGTDLFVVHWWQLGCAGHYTVVTSEGEPIWTLEPDVRYPFDDQDGRPRAANRMSLEEAKKHATLVGVKRPEQFSFRPFDENNYRTFSVKPAGVRAWRIEEVERRQPQDIPAPVRNDADHAEDGIPSLLGQVGDGSLKIEFE